MTDSHTLKHRGERMDRVATVASAACAVHCALSPLVLPLIPLAFGRLVGPGLEWGFTALSLALGIASLGHSFRALHRNAAPLAWFVIGIALLLLSKLADANVVELPMIIAGASCIIGAHILNLRLRRRVRPTGACPCSCHDEPHAAHPNDA